MDPIAQFKENQRQGWATFAPIEVITGTAAPHLVRFAGIASGQRVLDVACGTGVVALTAQRLGARVTGIDLTPELIAHAKENAQTMRAEVEWHVGDAEALPMGDASFDVVVSQFGHMFAPRPEVVVREMLRVLKPGGVIAFSTWPPELYIGRMFDITSKYAPALPAGISPPPEWGDPNVVRERLGTHVKELTFDRRRMLFPTLSPAHYVASMERDVGPVRKLVAMLQSDAPKLAAFRREVETLAASFFEDNVVRQDFLMTRAVKA